jgi:hypothetical protein
MTRNIALVLLAAVGLIVLQFPAAQGASWAEKMFETTEHDFGTVARGAKAEFAFVLKNIYLEDVHIASVRSSCGCTSPRIERPLLKTYEQGAILATINTKAFLGSKGATITVKFDKPFAADVKLRVRSYIRSDVVLHPGNVELGSVTQGTEVDQKIQVIYAGRDDWRILEVKSGNPHLTGQFRQVSRGGGRVTYELSVHLDGKMPVGYLKDHLQLVTNDRRLTKVPVPIEGRILSSITISPASLFMGVLEPGQEVTKQLVVRATKPFRILSITCDAGCLRIDPPEEQAPKVLHLIPVTFVAGAEPGKVVKTIHIETDLGDSAPELAAFAVVAQK